MRRRKLNSTRWYLLGLAAVLTAGCFLLSVGTALARYRVDNEKKIQFAPKAPATVTLGVMEAENFLPNAPISWREETLPPEEGETQSRQVYTLHFVMSNYVENEKGEPGFAEENLTVRLRLVGSLDAWDESAGGTLVLTDGILLEEETPREITATVTAIPEDTPLYHAFGVGWVFQFLDEEGQELTWELKGGVLSCQEISLTLDASAITGTSLLQLQVSGEYPE